MEAPAHVVSDLKDIRSTLELRLNPHAVRIQAGGFDAGGRPLPARFDPRWELWDTGGDSAPEHKVFTLQDEEGGYRSPGPWVVQFVKKINPERFAGDLDRMYFELFGDEDLQENIDEREFRDFARYVGRWAWDSIQKKVTVPADINGSGA